MNKRDALNRFGYAVKTKYDFVIFFLCGSYAKVDYTDGTDINIAERDYPSTLEFHLNFLSMRRNLYPEQSPIFSERMV
jgi:hypothetical protein